MSDDRARILERVKKLLALSNGKGATEAEAALAAERAQELLAEHKISEAELATPDREGIGTRKSIVTNSRPWRRDIGVPLAELYFCSYAFGYERGRRKGAAGKDHHLFIGTATNTAIASAMFAYLITTIDQLANKGAADLDEWEKGRYRTSFKAACAWRLAARLREKRKQSESSPTVTSTGNTLPALASLYSQELARVGDYMQQQGYGTARKSSSRPQSDRGLADGYRAGNNIAIDKQIGQGSQKRLA